MNTIYLPPPPGHWIRAGDQERPILFSGPMVRAILDGRKTQTRRIVKPQPPEWATHAELHMDGWFFHDGPEDREDLWFYPDYESDGLQCPFGHPGDRLWVRETWGVLDQFFEGIDQQPDRPFKIIKEEKFGKGYYGSSYVIYGADGPNSWANDEGEECTRWKPSIHMPRWASRITLEITGVRVERLKKITRLEALKEGFQGHEPIPGEDDERIFAWEGRSSAPDPLAHFAATWDSLYGFGSWEANPWVWVIEFRRIE